MLQKVLGWSTLGLALLFVLLSLSVMIAVGTGPLGASAKIVAFIAVGSLVTAILLTVSMLVISLFQ
jgi:hypothetical protein